MADEPTSNESNEPAEAEALQGEIVETPTAPVAEAPAAEAPAAPAAPSDLPPPPAAAMSSATGVYLVTIGDIGITADTIVTPNGTGPLAGSQWIFTDRTQTEQKIPSYAIILAIVFALACLIGLLFLLIKETRITGYAEVSVKSGNLSHMTQLPVNNANDVARWRGMVSQAQSLAAQAPA